MSNAEHDSSSQSSCTLQSGIVEQFHRETQNRPWKPTGRPKSTVCIFDARYDRLLYTLDSNDKVSMISRLRDPREGVTYKAIAVSSQSKTVRFEAEFVFGDTKVPSVALEIRIRTTEPDEVAVSFVGGGDPVTELCNSIRAYLDTAFKKVYLRDVDKLEDFMSQTQNIVENIKVSHPYLILEGAIAELKLPTAIEDTLQKRYEELSRHNEVIESRKHELVEKEKEYELSKMELRHELECKELTRRQELEAWEYEESLLGITSIGARLLMRDPGKRAAWLDRLYQEQMDWLKLRRDTIEKYREKVMSEYSEIGDLVQILKLIDDKTGIYSGSSEFSVIEGDIEQKSSSQPTSGNASDEETRQIEKDRSLRKRQRRFVSEAGEKDESEKASLTREDKIDQVSQIAQKADTNSKSSKDMG